VTHIKIQQNITTFPTKKTEDRDFKLSSELKTKVWLIILTWFWTPLLPKKSVLKRKKKKRIVGC